MMEAGLEIVVRQRAYFFPSSACGDLLKRYMLMIGKEKARLA
jgi:hypothetical protein